MSEKIQERLDQLEYKLNLILSGVRNLLDQHNPNGVNDHLLEIIGRAR